MGRPRGAALVLLVLALWPREAHLGTYGSTTIARKGYTLAMDSSVGALSDPSLEGELFAERQRAARALLEPHASSYDAWFGRVLARPHPYAAWLAALDRERATEAAWDYQARLPAPRPASAIDDGRRLELYLHLRPDAGHLAGGRALVGFALAEIALGPFPDLTRPGGAPVPLAERLRRALEGDSFTGQPALLAALLLDVHDRQDELARLAADRAAGPPLRLLAGIALRALRHQPWDETDLARAAAAGIDRRIVWTWALVTCSEAEAPARERALARRAPLTGDAEASFRAWAAATPAAP